MSYAEQNLRECAKPAYRRLLSMLHPEWVGDDPGRYMKKGPPAVVDGVEIWITAGRFVQDWSDGKLYNVCFEFVGSGGTFEASIDDEKKQLLMFQKAKGKP